MFRKLTTVLVILAALAVAGCVLSPQGDMDEHHVSDYEGI
jgi:hypothetical protein